MLKPEDKEKVIQAIKDNYRDDYSWFQALSPEKAEEIATKNPLTLPLDLVMRLQAGQSVDWNEILKLMRILPFKAGYRNTGAGKIFMANLKALGLNMPELGEYKDVDSKG